MSCEGFSVKGLKCTRKIRSGEKFCWQHKSEKTKVEPTKKQRKTKEILIGNTDLLNSNDSELWEKEYLKIMDKKYAKNTREFKNIKLSKHCGLQFPPIYLIPRVRGESYKKVLIEGTTQGEILYLPISKGFSCQDVSSFSLGPIIGEGLCLVNAAFSKNIALFHLEGGNFDPTKKNFWKSPRKPMIDIKIDYNRNLFVIDGKEYDIKTWLKANENSWFSEWEKWSQSVAMSSMGSFHWTKDSPVVGYYHKNRYIDFVEWKKECYIRPSYQLLPYTKVFQFMSNAWINNGCILGLVHPKAQNDHPEIPITYEYLRDLYDHPYEMVCQPYVIAGLLLNVEI